MSRILYFDCFAGASGDMILGALLDAGLPLEELRQALGSLMVRGYTIEAERTIRAGVGATKFRVRDESRPDPSPAGGDQGVHHHHHHQHHHQHDHEQGDHHHHAGHQGARATGRSDAQLHAEGHRRLEEILTLIERSALSATGKSRAAMLFRRLAEVEAAIHEIPVERVHLHEVGALDSIIDIVGAVFGLEWFGAETIVSSPLNVGGGMVACAHGTFPVPAPATTRLLANVPIYSSGLSAELVTPTGALLVTGHASSFGPLPPMRLERIGYGAGDRDFAAMPNTLRILIGESATEHGAERLLVIECQIDDMNPQIFGHAMDRLYAAGALEVFYAPVQMKKNRPGTHLTVVAPLDRREPLIEVLFRETTTIGLRYHEVLRERLAREHVTVQTAAGPVRVKVASRDGTVMNAAPEFDDCARAAAAAGLSVKEVQALAMKAYLEAQRPQT